MQNVSAKNLLNFCVQVLKSVQVCAKDAEITASALVGADLRGVDSHGCILLPLYVSRIQKREINHMAKPRLIKLDGCVALIDGDNGLGHPTATRAMKVALKNASLFGSAWVGVRGSHHFGMAAHYAMQALEQDMIGIVLTISNINTMAPWKGRDILVGNNPIAFAIPAGNEFPIVFDTAFSVAARRKIHDAKSEGKNIPEGWALDSEGNPTTDPQKALDGLLIPIGGYKGFGFAFVVSMLAGALTGAAFGASVSNQNIGHLIGAIDIKPFQDISVFKSQVDLAIREVHESRSFGGKLLVPGERGFTCAEERKRNGIPLSNKTVIALNALSQEFGIQQIGPA